MAGRFPPAWLEELRARSDLVQTVSGYVALKKRGRHYWGLCPFHGEKTASFSVDEEAQLYYCFGCKAGGTVFTFIQEMEHLSFYETVELLAERAHMPLPQMVDSDDWERRRAQRERLLGANREAARFFFETLYSPAGERALAYLRGRGLDDAVIRKFGLGAAPDSWDALLRRLTEKGYTKAELAQVNLIVQKEAEPATGDTPARPARAYDMFRNRVMFPIIDQFGNVIAFSGRILEKKGERKYLNTSDTPVFNKGKNIFGANLLKKERHLDRIILVEGNLDVVSLTQFGIKGVCATLGTALTQDQARLMKRFAPVICLAYDGDSAGQNAILKGLDIFQKEGIPCRVMEFPGGMDPDEFIRKEGPEAFAKLPEMTPEGYRLRRLRETTDLSGREGRIAYAREAVKIIAPLDPVEREGYMKDLTLHTGFDRKVLDAQLARETELLRRSAEDPWARRDSARNRAADPLAALGVEEEAPSAARSEKKKPLTEAERRILRAEELLISLTATKKLPEGLAQEEDFSDEDLREVFRQLCAGSSPSLLLDEAADAETRSRLARILQAPKAGSTDEVISMAQECVSTIRKAGVKKKMQEIQTRMANTSDMDEQRSLLEEFTRLSKLLRST